MKKLVLLVVASSLLTGCAQWYSAKYKTEDERKRALKIDEAECKGNANAQVNMQIINPGRTRSPAWNGMALGINTGTALRMSSDNDDAFDACMYRLGWVLSRAEYEQQKRDTAAAEQRVKLALNSFLTTHPEYRTESNMSRLATEVTRLTNDPVNRGLTPEQLFVLADERIKTAPSS
ncbi:hypothetical protein [Buttiauxella sp. S19-1]|uniref:hypothetical protein n=1 Tax=Buttiauxella sp. S19-1 TaxID=941430 RepID=UPI001EDACD1F|nr:hypothetical protein [Buttiauxella sp. S19-1]